MALTKIGKEGITGISNSSDATFLTATSSEGVTLAGTLAVTGVHTVGTNAVATSDGGATTISIVQGLCKSWLKFNHDTPAIVDSFGISTVSDNGTGNHSGNFTSNMSNANYANSCMKQAELTNQDCTEYTSGSNSTSAVNRIDIENNALRDSANTNTLTFGDLA